MSHWSYKAYKPTLVTICNAKRWGICSICVKMGKVIYYTESLWFVLLGSWSTRTACRCCQFHIVFLLLSGLICLRISWTYVPHLLNSTCTNVDWCACSLMSESSIRQRHVHMVAAAVIQCEESPSGINMQRNAWWEPCLHKKKVFSFLWLSAIICLCA